VKPEPPKKIEVKPEPPKKIEVKLEVPKEKIISKPTTAIKNEEKTAPK